ncbi:MAG: nickel pincer cofactor biosynthesis protein LarC [Oscillospiraceae bacterium]|nr:nickel pincer cofactor biosynthesis protein LarC [Oscillospiraceae bacterium]
MKTLYLECNMGAAGDMLMAALLELHPNPADFLIRLNAIGLPDVEVTAEPRTKCGITGTHVRVKIGGQEEHSHDHHGHGHHHHHDHSHDHDHHHVHDHAEEDDDHHDHGEHSHNAYHDIAHRIDHLNVSGTVKQNALAVYQRIADAESQVHGVPVSQIHFHEVGEMDALADIVGVCMLLEDLAPDQILASPIHVGSGHVRCSHGILPVPTPATALILQGVPIYSDQTKGELCTPTGAALIRHFASAFCALPSMAVSGIGYGMGTKDFDKANCVRAFLGATADIEEQVSELVCNLDDMTPEAIAFAGEELFTAGALDVYTTTIGMKKGRTGQSLTCMCRTPDKDKMLALLFKHTTTLGIREYVSRRYALQKEYTEVQTQYGPVTIKTSHGFGIQKTKPEYEDLAKRAREAGVSIQEVLEKL